MTVSSVASAMAPQPVPQPASAEAVRNGGEVRSAQESDKSAEARRTPPPDTSPQGKMVGSLVDTKA
jgi:hypothetical protein